MDSADPKMNGPSPDSAGPGASDEAPQAGPPESPESEESPRPPGEEQADRNAPPGEEGETPSSTPSSTEDDDSSETPSALEREQFRRQLEENLAETPHKELNVGDRIKVRIVQIGDQEAFLDYGGRSEGIIATQELLKERGELKYGVGDDLTATVEAVEGQVAFTLGKKPAPKDKDGLRELFDAKIPVEGTVKSTNKGGFEVSVSGRRAFCPYSQIDIAYVDQPDQFIGQRFTFQITRMEGGGRNIVLSRRVLLEEERKKKAEDTEARLRVGEVFDGVVCRVLPFGAFVDIGGIEALLHVSELSYGHVSDPKEILSPNQEIKVQVIGIQEGEKGRRISLSMRALEPDPWSRVAKELKVGVVVKGKVARLTNFGAFVELMPGVDGLLHVSEISTQRIRHPEEVLSPGEEVEVKILEVNLEKKRISLSRKVLEQEKARREERARMDEYHKKGSKEKRKEEPASPPPQPPPPTESMETLLDRLKNKFEDDTLG